MRDNYYILLELDPSVMDEASINKAITAKQQQWSAERNHPTKGNLAQQCLGKLQDIKIVLLNSELRNTEAEEAKKILFAEQEEKNKKLKTAASILVKNGEIKENDLKALAKKFKLSENEITTILKVRVIKEEITYKDDGIQLLDDAIIKKIRSELNIIRNKDLFDFLSLSPTSSCTVLLQKATEIYNQSSRNANKTAEVTATNSLATICQTYLKDETVKKRYQKSLQYESFDEIKELIDLAANDGSITAAEYQKLISASTEKGIPLDRAEFYIYDYCSKKKYPQPQKSDNPEYKKQVQCGVCGHLNEPASNNCTHCGTPLKLICPKCRNTANSIDKVCSNCGFSIGDMPNAIPLIRDAKIELANRNFEQASKYLESAKVYWPNHKDIKELEQKINNENETVASNLKQANEYRKNKEYVALLSFIKTIKAEGNPLFSACKTEAENSIASASSIFAKAKALTDNSAKIDSCMQVLTVCADMEEAKKELKLNPPQTPSNFKVSALGNTVRLNWDKLRSMYVKYSVVRKINGQPQHPSDGEVIAVIDDSRFDDANTTPGVSYYYAVYGSCADIYSKNAALEGPVITMNEIANSSLKYDIQEKHINFSCKFPQNAKTIEVFRDNTLIKTLNSENFLDTGLVAEKQYTYRFKAIYEDCLGKKYRTNGVEVQLTPSSPPKAVELTLSLTESKATIAWVNPAKGILEIYESDKAFSENQNDIVNTDSFNGGAKIPLSGTSRVINKDFNGIRYYLPLTVAGKIGVVGRQIKISSVLKPQGVSLTKTGEQNINVSWTWSNGANAVRIRSSVNGGTGMDTDIYRSQTSSTTFKVSIPKEAKNIKVEIMTLFKSDSGEILISEPVENFFNLQTTIVEFMEVKKGGLFSKNKYMLTVKADIQINSDLHLLIREGLPPVNINNYESKLTIPAKDLAANKPVSYTLEYAKEDKNEVVFFRLIPADKSQRNNIVISPEMKKIK